MTGIFMLLFTFYVNIYVLQGTTYNIVLYYYWGLLLYRGIKKARDNDGVKGRGIHVTSLITCFVLSMCMVPYQSLSALPLSRLS